MMHICTVLPQATKLSCISPSSPLQPFQSKNLVTGRISWNVSLCFSNPFSAVTQFPLLGAHFSAWGKLDADEVLCQTLWLTTKKSDFTNVVAVCPAVLTETGVDSLHLHSSLIFIWNPLGMQQILIFLLPDEHLKFWGKMALYLRSLEKAVDLTVQLKMLRVRWSSVCGQTHKQCWFLWPSR